MRHETALTRGCRPLPDLARLEASYEGLGAEAMLERAIRRDFAGRIALVSSFGAESAALLAMVARIDPATPVLFVETGMLFAETLAYQRDLAARLGLSDLRLLRPEPEALAARDPDGALHRRDPDGCCALRKVAPLRQGLAPFRAWISGRKRAQAATRANLPLVEFDEAARVKLNPLADWSAAAVAAFMRERNLPPHPLVDTGYLSIGCAPCTTPVAPGEDPRAGRWRGRDKIECGIHVDASGRIRRVASAAG